MAYNGSGGFKSSSSATAEDEGRCCGCRLIAHTCCLCASLQTGSSLIGLVGIIVSIVLLILQMINGVSVAIILCSISTILLSICLLYTSPSPRDRQKSRMPSSA